MLNPFSGQGKANIARRLPGVDDATIDDYIADAWAKATSVAPCIAADTFPSGNTDEEKAAKSAELVAILRGIILRWNDAQSGVKTQMAAGPYQQTIDPGVKRGWHLWPSEVVDLQRLCRKPGQPFTFDTMPDDFQSFTPLQGAVVNGDTETLNGPPGEWSEDAPVLDV